MLSKERLYYYKFSQTFYMCYTIYIALVEIKFRYCDIFLLGINFPRIFIIYFRNLLGFTYINSNES